MGPIWLSCPRPSGADLCRQQALGQWLATGAPLALAAPVAAIGLGAKFEQAPLILACALIGGLAFAFTGGIGAALSLGARRGGLLTAVIVLPLFVPPVIFGGGASGLSPLVGLDQRASSCFSRRRLLQEGEGQVPSPWRRPAATRSADPPGTRRKRV